jgi:UDP-2-acetamido-3-amino-2,3-dideoxy-glucuronate N-acetyltransferase
MGGTGYFAHESSYVDEGAVIGAGTKIWHFSHVMPGAVIGERCNLGQNVVVMPGTRIGNNVKIQNNVSIYEGVVLEDDVFCGPSCVFTNVLNPRSHVSRKHEYRTTLVKRGGTIGANATIVCGVTLGEYAFVGAGAVVTADAPAFGLMVGVPARRVGWMCQCGERLQPAAGRAACGVCRATYEEQTGVLRQITPPRPS